ncbi:MAG: NUDIX domain-containing protein [Sporichthyaceae bacterium]
MTLADLAQTWPVRSSRIAFQGAKIAIRVDEVQMPDGVTAVRDLVVHPGSAGVLVLDDTDPGAPLVLVLSQYRHPVSRRLWEFPAGLLDEPGESALLAAQRELAEEAHLTGGDWRVLVDAYTSPGCSDEAVRIYLARGTRAVEGEHVPGLHEEADLELRWVALTDLVHGVLAGELHNPLTVMGVLALHAAMARPGGLAALRPPDAPWSDRTA